VPFFLTILKVSYYFSRLTIYRRFKSIRERLHWGFCYSVPIVTLFFLFNFQGKEVIYEAVKQCKPPLQALTPTWENPTTSGNCYGIPHGHNVNYEWQPSNNKKVHRRPYGFGIVPVN